jgi:hypothetical protein
MSLSQPTWKLTEELEELTDPPAGACRIRIELSNLVFKEFITDTEVVRKKPELLTGVVIFNKPIHTSENIQEFITYLRYSQGFFHTHATPQTIERIWFDLINDFRHGKNRFVMDLPFLFRISTKVPDSLENLVFQYKKEHIILLRSFPHHLEPDSFIGLYSGTMVLTCNTSPDSSLPLLNREIWPDIPLVFSDIHQPAACCPLLTIRNLCFVSTVTEESILALIPAKQKEYAVLNWFKPYLNIFKNI